MKIALAPINHITEAERDTLHDFQAALDAACGEVECDTCRLNDFCRAYADAPQVLAELLEIVQI